jgi:G3E family GTPase
MSALSKIPVILVTGFLGSGKTTFLLRLAERHPDKAFLFLVNEFSPAGVDDHVLADSGRPTQSVVGGSLFCECKAGEFVRVMRGQVLDMHREGKLDQVIIETSGIADPEAIGRLMASHGLDEHFAVQRIVCVLAPPRFPRLLANLPAVRAQVQTSDYVILNKVDLSTPEQINSAAALVREINPGAEIVTTRHCQADLAFIDRAAALPTAELATCDANPFSTETLSLPGPVDHTALVAALEALPPAILRVKGHVVTDRGWHLVQQTVDSSTVEPTGEQSAARLVLVVHDDDEVELARVLSDLRHALIPA